MSYQPERTSSRLARRQQQKIVKQTMLYGIGAVVLIVLFIFVILPGFIRVITSGNPTTDPSLTDNLPPQVPILSAPPEATPESEIILSGFGEAGSTIVFLVNGLENTQVVADSEGAFQATITLEDGNNTITAYAKDEAGAESATSQSLVIIRDSQPPTLDISEPQEGQEITGRQSQNVTIAGTTEANARIYVNGRLSIAQGDGSFSTTYFLSEGENKLEIVAQDRAGNEQQTTLTIQFRL